MSENWLGAAKCIDHYKDSTFFDLSISFPFYDFQVSTFVIVTIFNDWQLRLASDMNTQKPN